MPAPTDDHEGTEPTPIDVTPEGKKPKAGTVAAGRYIFDTKHPRMKASR